MSDILRRRLAASLSNSMALLAGALLIASAPSVTAGGIITPAGYENFFNPATGHYYALTLQPEPFLDARAEAQATNNELATVNDAAENDWLVDTLSPLVSDIRFWIGLSDELVEGTFVWDSGELLTYTNWDAVSTPDEPNGGTGENFVELQINLPNPAQVGTWNDTGTGLVAFGVIESTGLIVPEPSSLVICTIGGLALLAYIGLFTCASCNGPTELLVKSLRQGGNAFGSEGFGCVCNACLAW